MIRLLLKEESDLGRHCLLVPTCRKLYGMVVIAMTGNMMMPMSRKVVKIGVKTERTCYSVN